MSAPATHHLLGDLALPRGMVWSDEFGDWARQERSHQYSIAGSLLIDVAARQEGRPITLSGAGNAGWIHRDALEALRTLSEDAEAEHTLTLADGRTFTVRFAADTAPVTATPVGRPELPADWQRYIATVRLVTVTPAAPDPEPEDP